MHRQASTPRDARPMTHSSTLPHVKKTKNPSVNADCNLPAPCVKPTPREKATTFYIWCIPDNSLAAKICSTRLTGVAEYLYEGFHWHNWAAMHQHGYFNEFVVRHRCCTATVLIDLTILLSLELSRCPQNASMAASIFAWLRRSAGGIDSWICSSTLTQTEMCNTPHQPQTQRRRRAVQHSRTQEKHSVIYT